MIRRLHWRLRAKWRRGSSRRLWPLHWRWSFLRWRHRLHGGRGGVLLGGVEDLGLFGLELLVVGVVWVGEGRAGCERGSGACGRARGSRLGFGFDGLVGVAEIADQGGVLQGARLGLVVDVCLS